MNRGSKGFETVSRHPYRPHPILLGLLLFFGAFTLYVLLGQETFYKIDGQSQILRVMRGTEPHPHHILQDALLRSFASFLDGTGLRFFIVARTLSALGMALAVLFSFAAALRLGLGRVQATLATLLIACAPGVLFYGTVIEFHGVYLPFAALTLLACIHAGKTPGALPILGTSLAYAFATLVHSSAVLLLPFCTLFGLALERERSQRWALKRWLLFLPLALLMAVLIKKAIILLGIVPPIQEGSLRQIALQRFGPIFGRIPGADWVLYNLAQLHWTDLKYLPHSILREWLLPALPSSIFFLLPLKQRVSRLRSFAVLLGLLPFLALSFILMTRKDEFGAYVLPMLIPAALVSASCLPRAPLILGLSLGLVYGIYNVRKHDIRPNAQKVQLLENAEAKLGPFTILCDEKPEGWLWPALIAQHRPSAWTLQELGLKGFGNKDTPLVIQRIQGLVASEAKKHRKLLLSQGALRLLQDPKRMPIGPKLLNSLRPSLKKLPGKKLQEIGFQIQ